MFSKCKIIVLFVQTILLFYVRFAVPVVHLKHYNKKKKDVKKLSTIHCCLDTLIDNNDDDDDDVKICGTTICGSSN